MEDNNNKNNNVGKAVKAGAFLTAAAILLGSCHYSEKIVLRVKVSIQEDDAEKNKELINEEDNYYKYDIETNLYKIDFVKMLEERYELSEKDIKSDGVQKLIELVYERLGQDIYSKQPIDNTLKLCNIDDEELMMYFYKNGNTNYFCVDYVDEDNTKHITQIYKNGKINDHQSKKDINNYTYTLDIDNEKETQVGINYKIKDEENYSNKAYFSIQLSGFGDIILHGYYLYMYCDYGSAQFKLSKEEYNNLKDIIKEYSKEEDYTLFLLANPDLINNYLEETKQENERLYEKFVEQINLITTKDKALKLGL
ncbi:MAG: hypothetical protein IJ572_04025 [Bacilli bacterium]|nr:hypothetical protein [Bacilli bacterium]